MTDSQDRVEEMQLTTLSRLVEGQRIVSERMSELLDQGEEKIWSEYLPGYWRWIETRLQWEKKIEKVVAARRAKDPNWSLTQYLQLDSAVSQP